MTNVFLCKIDEGVESVGDVVNALSNREMDLNFDNISLFSGGSDISIVVVDHDKVRI